MRLSGLLHRMMWALVDSEGGSLAKYHPLLFLDNLLPAYL